jgi:hypothetical protein
VAPITIGIIVHFTFHIRCISVHKHFLYIYHQLLSINSNYYRLIWIILGTRGGVVVKALRYKPAGRGFDSWWCHWNFSVT